MPRKLKLLIWTWESGGFKWPFIEPARFARQHESAGALHGMSELFIWLSNRVNEGLLYDDTERCRSDPQTCPLAIHIVASSNGEVFLGARYDEKLGVLRLMGLWHVTEATEQMFINAAMQEPV